MRGRVVDRRCWRMYDMLLWHAAQPTCVYFVPASLDALRAFYRNLSLAIV